MPRAQSVIDVMLGEGAYGNPTQRYADLRAIASTIQNRARALGVTPEQVIANSREFNAYGRSLPAGVGNWRGLAQRAWDDVQTNGPSHTGMFYATPNAAANLPRGLERVTSTTGHVYYSDPQNRAIGTSLGYRQPIPLSAGQQAIEGLLSTPASRRQEAHGLLVPAGADAGLSPGFPAPLTPVERAPIPQVEPAAALSFDMARFGEPAPQSLFDTSRFGPSTNTATGMNELRRGLLDQQLSTGLLPSLDQPAYAAMKPQQPQPSAYVDPMVTTQQPAAFEAQPTGIQPVEEAQTGLFPAAPVSGPVMLAADPYDPAKRKGIKTGKKVAGALGGAVIGGLLAGPLGGLLGGWAGPKLVEKSQLLNGRDYFPAAPQAQNNYVQRNGYGGLSEYGREAYDRSQQVRDAVDNNSVGLF
ncbi:MULTISPECIES: hypothetical protein [unclassified Rhizobium]|uniref:hypothetical protein n=1 Tax=unclassified Rhizobium TaxID=2613769 RepID=UPI0006F5B952|nr:MULTISPECIES: hypothetical protein [unclassified Rhizobium]KQV39183.1 hypothetical protein ASC86_23230 [Rhizobium sp. Root1212]KRD35157.1 hypothetical protein ASE37_21800 [Rhizobium sp. Root268]